MLTMWRQCWYLGAIWWSPLGVGGRTNLQWVSEITVWDPCTPPVRRLRGRQAWGSDTSPVPPTQSWSAPLGRNLPSSPSFAVWKTKHLADNVSQVGGISGWGLHNFWYRSNRSTIVKMLQLFHNRWKIRFRLQTVIFLLYGGYLSIWEYLSVGICWCSWLSNIIRHHPPPPTIPGLYSEYSDSVQSPSSLLLLLLLPTISLPPLMSVDNSDQEKLWLITSPGQARINSAHPALPPPSYSLLQSN